MSPGASTQAVVVAAVRTPIGRAHKGSLVDVRPDDLAALAVRAAVARVPELPVEEIDDLILGCGDPAGEAGRNVARIVSILAGLPSCPGVTVNRYCASSLQAVRMAMHAIRAGEGVAFVAAGVESVSRSRFGSADQGPHNRRFAEAEERSACRATGGQRPWTPTGGLPDAYIAMGQTAENVRELEGISRTEMDEFALRSHRRALDARAEGLFEDEIVPIATPVGAQVVDDDGPRADTSLEKLSQLKPAFRPDGEVTAGNSCPLNDGAAAVLVMGERRARELQIEPLARIVSSAVSGIDPEIMGLGPVEASRLALRRSGMTIDDVDLAEINEAFAAQVIPCARRLGLDFARLNVRGGAIALGHPFGMTGARLVTTLVSALRHEDSSVGLATLCVGGGQGMALVLERLA